MKVIDHFQELGDCTFPIVTSGTFDGVHSGHFKILNGLVQQARDRGGESLVITYWPHPRFVLGMGSSSLRLLSTFDEKVKLLSDIGIDYIGRIYYAYVGKCDRSIILRKIHIPLIINIHQITHT